MRQVFVFLVTPSRQNLAQSAHDSAPIGPKGSNTWDTDNADDLRRDYLLVSRVHQLIGPVELIAPNPEAELVVKTIRGKHVPMRVEFPKVGLSQELDLVVEVRLFGLRPDDFQPGPLLLPPQAERAYPQAVAQYARYELR